ncbi:MAG: hypothetical protein ACYTBJ_12125 [Planctomycetota bacterium]
MTKGNMTINEGDFYPSCLQVFNVIIKVSGGTITENLCLSDDSHGEIYGGCIGKLLVLDDTSDASMYGGHVVEGVSSPENGEFSWYGGTIEGALELPVRGQELSGRSRLRI